MEIRTVLPDGSENPETEFDLPVVDRDGNAYDPPVVIRCRPIESRERREIEKASEVFVKNKGRGMERQTDANKGAQTIDAPLSRSCRPSRRRQPLRSHATTRWRVPRWFAPPCSRPFDAP